MENALFEDLGPEIKVQYDGLLEDNLPVAAFLALLALAFVGWEMKVRDFPAEWIGFCILTLLVTVLFLLGAFLFRQWYVINQTTGCLEWRQSFAGFEWRRKVLELKEVEYLMLNPKYIMARGDWYWKYPLCLVTRLGKKIPLSNVAQTRNREEFSLPLARGISETIGVTLVEGEPEQAVSVVMRQGRVCFEPYDHNPNTGLAGKLVVFLALGTLIWALWALSQY